MPRCSSSLPGALSFVIAAAEGLNGRPEEGGDRAEPPRAHADRDASRSSRSLDRPSERSGRLRQRAAPPASVDLAILFAAALAAVARHGPAAHARRLDARRPARQRRRCSSPASSRRACRPSSLVPCTIAIGAITGSRFRPGDHVHPAAHRRPRARRLRHRHASSAPRRPALVTLLFGVNFIQTLLAFAPGALEALTILAFQMNIDPAYVAAHHVVRFVALVAAVPLVARWLSRKP